MMMKMIFRFILICCCLTYSYAVRRLKSSRPGLSECLLGYMTDVQLWVDADGVLNHRYVDINNSIDLSYITNPEPQLQQQMSTMRSYNYYVRYLSLANCALTRVPLVFQLTDSQGRDLSETVEFMTFYGNSFVSVSLAGMEYDEFLNATDAIQERVNLSYPDQESTIVWSSALESTAFPRLKELDLRACSIQTLTSGLFRGMQNLQALYIGENEIHQIQLDAFLGLENLYHLDFSRNLPLDDNGNPKNLASDSFYPFENLTNLVSLDLSHTKLTPRNIGMLRGLKKNLKSLSLCNTSIANIDNNIFENTSLEVLDISRNNGILGASASLKGLEKSLIVLYATDIGLQSLDMFRNFSQLEILQLTGNEIGGLKKNVAGSLKKLQVLDLDKNRFNSWFNLTFTLMPRLRFLTLRNNNINVLTEEMLDDFKGVDYLALSGNSLVCNCHVKDFYKMAALNEDKYEDTKLESLNKHLFNTGYVYYNAIIKKRNPVVYNCEEDSCEDFSDTGQFRLVDHLPGKYSCLKVPGSQPVMFADVGSCNISSRDNLDYDHELYKGKMRLLALLAIPAALLPLLFVFIFRRNLKYCIITMRNSAMLSLINNKDSIDDGTIFNYDVFVSYCNEDRGWVLDHLLPHMEAECSISACLHERDFQVGLSILENIVSCMDRSKSIMLIISQRFLLSQWCQFEMHLAQHRLLETRREDLILVLLEDIPRRLRPNTLHYLMLTKTYIVWPKSNSERAVFWRRMKKSLLSQKSKATENVSLA